jgi:GxxExxY protein
MQDEQDSKEKRNEITGKILGISFQVLNELGAGFLEHVYEGALALALRSEGLKVDAQVSLDVRFRGEIVGKYVADLIVEDVILCELKTVKALIPEHQAQVINYLKATGLRTGLLLNFGRPTLEYKRLYA